MAAISKTVKRLGKCALVSYGDIKVFKLGDQIVFEIAVVIEKFKIVVF